MVAARDDTSQSQINHPCEPDAESRREILEQLGRFAYVAPAMMLLVDPANAKDDYKDKPPKPTKRPKD